MKEIIIDIQNLRKEYRIQYERIVALNRIDLQIPKGEICALVGTSGSGKSTLLNMIAGLEKPTTGTVMVNGYAVHTLKEKKLADYRQQCLGFVFQSFNLMPTLTALENVAMPLAFMGMPKKKRNAVAKEILHTVGLGNRIKHLPTQMSGGQQQRVAIARAFSCTHPVLLADEPTGNLDSNTTIEVMEMMVKFVRTNDITMVLVTHDAEIAQYADRIIHIKDGNIEKEERKNTAQSSNI